MNAEERLEYKISAVKGEKCDRYDYLIAAFCGLSAGLIDAFFVGKPGASMLGQAADYSADKLVENISRVCWNADSRPNRPHNPPQSLDSCIRYMENAFPVSYDARYASDLKLPAGVLEHMGPTNHHLLSLGHAPDVIGLSFSIASQFTDAAYFVDSGKIIRVYPAAQNSEMPYLQGSNLISMLFCGFVNWFGHLISDIAGSGSSRRPGMQGRGAGIPIPFYELLTLCDFGNLDGKSFAEIALTVFTHGYDLRHAGAMAVPVILNELMVRFLWSLKRHFYSKKPWSECIPTNQHADLRWMLMISYSAFCMVDGIDAIVRSGGNILAFLLHINLIAWFKLLLMILKEISLRWGFTYEDLKLQYQKINRELDAYLAKLKAVDYPRFEHELSTLKDLRLLIQDNNTDTKQLYSYLLEHGTVMQFTNFEEFDQKMKDDDFILKI